MFFCFKVKYNYDKNNNISNKSYVLNNLNQNINYTYNDDNSIIKTELDNNEVNYTYDYLGRITNRNINNSYNTDYTYITNGKRTSLLVKTLKNNNDIYKYKYDKLNNITHIYLNDNLINRYYYDNYNELIKEHDYQNNQTIEYTYDNYGNLLSKKIYVFNTTTLVSENTYEYSNTNWVDQLTKFNNESITYDAIGNPLTIGNKTLSWIWGRSLYSYNDGTNNIVYKYNKDNIRTIKWINNTPTYYYLEGNDIVFEETNNNVIYYIRDISGLTGFKYNNNIYYYVKNLQNDIIGILDSNYQEIVKYKYDSWGNILSILDNNGNDISNNSTHIANINPYRYRSYYYDKETKLYYISSRYYNSKVCRFINADSQLNINEGPIGYNVYVYCNNNPTMYFDPTGHLPFFAITSTIGATIGAIAGGIRAAKKGKSVWTGALKGAIIGGLVGLGTGAIVSGLITGSTTATTAAVLGTASVKLAATGSTLGITASKGIDYLARSYEKASSIITGTTNVYRSISSAEAANIMNTNQFNFLPGGMEVKQFAFSYGEAMKFGSQSIINQTSIVSASVPNSVLNQLYSHNVDYGIFTGIITVDYETIGLFNEAVAGTIRIMP